MKSLYIRIKRIIAFACLLGKSLESKDLEMEIRELISIDIQNLNIKQIPSNMLVRNFELNLIIYFDNKCSLKKYKISISLALNY